MNNSNDLDVELIINKTNFLSEGVRKEDLINFKTLFKSGNVLGSLIKVPTEISSSLLLLKKLSQQYSQDIFIYKELKLLKLLIRQAELLSKKYDAVVANPPFSDSKYHCSVLKNFLSMEFKPYKRNLFSAFIYRCLSLTKNNGRNAYVTPFVWLYLDSYKG